MENLIQSVQTSNRMGHAVDALLQNREALLLRYCGLLSLGLDERGLLGRNLAEFNQMLTDYLALGHFEVIEPSVATAGYSDDFRAELPNQLAAIQLTTERILRFTDRFGGTESARHNLVDLAAEIDELGQIMANRFALEDGFLSELNQI
ncbi:MAG: Rsd/AlgQ family anti-sigma factor [Thiotrichales bacterium]